MRLLACLIVAPQRGYDEPATLSYAISSFCPTSADGLHKGVSIRLQLRRDAGFDGFDCTGIPRSERRDRPLGAQVPASGATDADGKAPDDAHPCHQGGLHLYTARRTRHARADCDGEDGTRQLPRLRIVDDRGSPLARARGPLRVWLSLRSLA